MGMSVEKCNLVKAIYIKVHCASEGMTTQQLRTQPDELTVVWCSSAKTTTYYEIYLTTLTCLSSPS